MNQYTVLPTPVEESVVPSAPPSYDEAVGTVRSDQNSSNSPQVPDVWQEEKEAKKEDQQIKEAAHLANAPTPLVVTQPQPQTTYTFTQPVVQQPQPASDCMCCLWVDGQDIADLCYCIFCCSRHVTGHDAGCCDCGETCCSCPDGCCECGDCECGDCDCGDCDCGDCDCNCGDCTIL